jgi:hypothetical protein
MSTGSGFYGDEPEPGRRPVEPGQGGAHPDDDATFADVMNSFTLNSGRRRRRKKDRESDVEATDGPRDTGPRDTAPRDASPRDAPRDAYPRGMGRRENFPEETRPRADSPPADPHSQWTEPVSPAAPPAGEPTTASRRPGLFGPAGEPSRQTGDLEEELPGQVDETAVVRPYALTGGRTKTNYALELETLVSTRDNYAAGGDFADAVPDLVEHRSIMEECRTPRSVAELAARLRVPLGVARVLISDAADAGLIVVHKTISGNDGAEAHLMLMERVLSGLRRL